MFFWNSLAFFYDPADVGNLFSDSSSFSKSNLNIQKFFIDFCYSSVFSPRMLINFISTFLCGSMIQLYFFRFFTIPEIYVLTSMAYDCYVAICNPLFYNAAMSPKVCSSLMLASYLMAFSGAIGHTGCMFRLTFCEQSPSTIISGISFLCSSSPAQISTLVIWYFSLRWASKSLCPVSPYLSLMVSFSSTSSISAPWRAGQSLQYLLPPNHCCFSLLWIMYIYVSQTFIFWVYG